MAKKLWHVSIEGECYVWAESADEAGEIAKDSFSSYSPSEAGVDSFWASEVPVQENATASISDDWSESIPFGEPPEGFEDLCVEEALEKLLEDRPVPPHPDQTDLFGRDRPVSPEDEADDPDEEG